MMNDKHGWSRALSTMWNWSAENTLEQLGGGEDGVTGNDRLFY